MESQRPPERTLIVGVEITGRRKPDSGSPPLVVDAEESLAELAELATGAGAEIAGRVLQVRSALDSATLIGSGKAEEVRRSVEADGIETVIFDHELTPTQLRNLERLLPAKVLDRTQLILDIFARRARTAEGQLRSSWRS